MTIAFSSCLRLVALLVPLIAALPVSGQESRESHLPVDGRIAPDGSSVTLDWFDTDRPREGGVTVKRRNLGETGASTWQTLAAGIGGGMRYTDDTVSPGVAYEYQVLRIGRDIIDVGYWATGVAIPAPDAPKVAYLVVDETIAPDLSAHLERFARDLRGAGWRVHKREVGRRTGDLARDLDRLVTTKDWLRTRYVEDPPGVRAVILIGHVPIIESGRANPDGHDPVPHATDLIYGDVHGRWRIAEDGALLDNQLPTDFIEMQVGRIDFAAVSGGDPARERHLLRHYFDKNHHWRMGLHGDLRVAYGQSPYLTAELYGLRNIVGPGAITPGGHHDVGEDRPWLWGVDFGHWDGAAYATDYANKAIFAINFGSGKQRFDRPFNPMAALLAQPFYPVAVGWGARPAWWLHHMALGGTIGDVHMRTVNNGIANLPYLETMDYFPTGSYLWRNPVWVNLLGDPTLHAFVLAPPGRARATPLAEAMALTWEPSPDPDTAGYRVYRAADDDAPFTLVSGPEVMTETMFHDPNPVEAGVYMIRAEGMKTVYAGSFVQRSQGVFVFPDSLPPEAPDLALRTDPGQPVALPAFPDVPEDQMIQAIIAPPATGTLAFDGEAWVYTPAPGFTGEVVLRYAVTQAGQTATGDLAITVGD